VNDQLRRRSVGAPAARSTLLTLLGEYVLPLSAGVWLETLVSAMNTLEYTTAGARRAIARSVDAGWLRTERRGRRSRVHLTDDTAAMLRSGAERIYGFGETREWDGRWLLVVVRVPEEQREVRHFLRSQLAWAGFGSLGNGLWISPHVAREAELATMAEAAPAAEMLAFRAELGQIGAGDRVVAEAWDLERVADAYRDFIACFRRQRPKTPEAMFRTQTQLVHAWRKFPYMDPDLPERALPRDWPRSAAREVFTDRRAAWNDQAQQYFRLLDGSGDAPSGDLVA
jgi:phenylacetic acid degradation operon negative regulatory protein